MNIGKYKVAGLLGRGGMGAVYKAMIPLLGKTVALKALCPTEEMAMVMDMDRIRARFMAEARTMAGLNHPNIAAVWDLEPETEDHPAFFTMEYCCLNLGIITGESYRAETPSRRLPVDKALNYAAQTLDGLGRMHHAGIIHRDIKPFNLLIADMDVIKIIDFGLSRSRGEAKEAPGSMKIGTPYYTAPEQERDPNLAGPGSDMFSAAVVLFRMLTGLLPDREALDEAGALAKFGPHKIPMASSLCPELPEEFDQFFFTCLDPSPEHRPDSAETMRAMVFELEKAWEKNRDMTCSLAQEYVPAPGKKFHLRATPVKTYLKTSRRDLNMDQLGRPLTIIDNDFHAVTNDIMLDRTTGLAWQKSGSTYPLTWEEAHEYIHYLNREKFGGHGDWRLPTIDELCSLTRPVDTVEALCLDDVFDPEKANLWSIDSKTHTSSWFLNAPMGFVHFQDNTCRFWARAVRTIEQE